MEHLEVIKENDKTYLSGSFLVGDKTTENNRLYPKELIESSINQLNNDLEKGHTFLGEFFVSPENKSDKLEINLENVSHKIVSAWIDDNSGYVRVEILNTPAGRSCKDLINLNRDMRFFPKGTGLITESTNGYVVSDYNLISVDIVPII